MSRRVVFTVALVRPPSQRSRYDEVLVRQIRHQILLRVVRATVSGGCGRMCWLGGMGHGRERVAAPDSVRRRCKLGHPGAVMPRDLGERPVKALAPNKLARQFAAMSAG